MNEIKGGADIVCDDINKWKSIGGGNISGEYYSMGTQKLNNSSFYPFFTLTLLLFFIYYFYLK